MVKVVWAGEREVKAYRRGFEIEINGKVQSVTVYWDEHDGYEVYFNWGSNTTPEELRKRAVEEGVSVGYLIELLADGEAVQC
jgi:hypothetical protein